MNSFRYQVQAVPKPGGRRKRTLKSEWVADKEAAIAKSDELRDSKRGDAFRFILVVQEERSMTGQGWSNVYTSKEWSPA